MSGVSRPTLERAYEFVKAWAPYIVTCHETSEARIEAAATWATVLMSLKWVNAMSYDDKTRFFAIR